MRKETIFIDITCMLDMEYFRPWKELTQEQQKVFEDKHTRCDGSGAIGYWCAGCDFCDDFNEVS